MPERVPDRGTNRGTNRVPKTILVLALAFVLSGFLRVTDAEAAKRAILIGINGYPENSYFSPLKGAVNDVALMEEVLVERLGYPPENVVKLIDAEATRSGVIKAMKDMAGILTKEDQLYIHYSGHGSTACDLNLDEGTGGLDSTLVTYGSRSGMSPGKSACMDLDLDELREIAAKAGDEDPDGFDLLDDGLNVLLGELTELADLVIFVADSCHSATITRGEKALPTRGVPMDSRVNPDAFLDPGQTAAKKGNWIAIGSASLPNKAPEREEDGEIYGNFTWFWAKA
ncbi:MAG: caspase family protein, partial [Deltaproteobacteria bacterium]|nr:caspase family protein [Deltaproteobacteria bacterium]